MGEYDDAPFYEDEDGIPYFSEPREVRCNRCRTRGLIWRERGGAWRLWDDEAGRWHECPPASLDEFDVLE